MIIGIININAQTSSQCLTIDFESIVNAKEGLKIDNQFLVQYGVSFELENGGRPVLAKVGSPTTAFSSNIGGDTPMPNQDIGEYFITDDGKISNFTAIPLIVRFTNPLDSVSAVVLDMDFDEIFTVTARGMNDEVLLEKIVQAGDEGTGDGIATVFGFNLEGCKGAIYSLKFQGVRQASGGFGFAMDNFSFCFSGIDVERNIEINVTPAKCPDFTGSIELINKGPDVEYEYSLDGITYFPLGKIDNLPVESYIIKVKNSEECSAEFLVEIEPPTLVDATIGSSFENTSCGKANGVIKIIGYGDSLRYSINGAEFQSDSIFRNLEAGRYSVLVKNNDNCYDTFIADVQPSNPIIINQILTDKDYCEESRGKVEFDFEIDDTYTLTLNGQEFEGSIIENLLAGEYKISIKDSRSCEADTSFKIVSTPKILLTNISSSPTSCDEEDAIITVSMSGGTGSFNYKLNEEEVKIPFNGLKIGTYHLLVTDELGCTAEKVQDVVRGKCPVYLPNIFHNSERNGNSLFNMKTLSDYNATILLYDIYDRWGNKIYNAVNFSIHDDGFWWNGNMNGKPIESGVYAYVIKIQHPNTEIEVLSGDVTFLRR